MEELNRKILEVSIGKVNKKDVHTYIDDDRQIGMFQIREVDWNNNRYELENLNVSLTLQSSGYGSWDFYTNSLTDESNKFKPLISGHYRLSFQITCFDTNYDDSNPVELVFACSTEGGSYDLYKFPLDKFTNIAIDNGEILISRKDMITYNFNELINLDSSSEYYFELRTTSTQGPDNYDNIKLSGTDVDFQSELITEYRQMLIDTHLTRFIVEYACPGHPV